MYPKYSILLSQVAYIISIVCSCHKLAWKFGLGFLIIPAPRQFAKEPIRGREAI